MIPDHARKRLDALAKVLKNAGLGDAGVSRVLDIAAAYETERGGPPLSESEILDFVRSRAFSTEREQRQAEAFLGAYLVFSDPSIGIDVSSLIQGLLSLEPDTALRTAQRALEGEGPLGRFATRTMSFLTRETVRHWLAPIGALALVVLAFMENPSFIFMRMMYPTPTRATRQLDMTDPAVRSATQEAALARDLMTIVERRWKSDASPTLGDLAALSASASDFAPLVSAYELDVTLWPGKTTKPPAEIVLRGKQGSPRVLYAGPDSVTVIDPGFVITTEGYR